MSQTFTPISSIGEFGFIARLRDRLGDVPHKDDLIAGIGDDAAVYRAGEGMLHVVTTDMLIEGVHFDRSFIPMPHLGFKAISVNVSDVAAMNARPFLATVALGVPRNLSVEMADALYDGMAEACKKFGMEIAGGDVSTAPVLTISVTVVGQVLETDVVFRRGANVGDLLCVTGDVGGAFAGLQILLDQRRELEELGDLYEPRLDAHRYVISRQLRPVARLDMVDALRKAGIKPTAMIDVSDGVSSEVHHIASASGCGATVRIGQLPFDPETRAVADQMMEDIDTYALFGGEDYELLFTVRPEDASKVEAMEGVSVIGKMEELAKGVRAYSPDTGLVPLHPAGYEHFAPGEGTDGAPGAEPDLGSNGWRDAAGGSDASEGWGTDLDED